MSENEIILRDVRHNYLLTGKNSERLYFDKVNSKYQSQWLPFFENPATRVYWKSAFKNPTEECEKWYQYQYYRYKNGLGGMNALIEKKSGRFIGHCGLLVQTVDGSTELEIGYSLLPQCWNKGYATEAAKKCRNTAFGQDWTDSLISIISLTNIPSQKVAEKTGMKVVKTTKYQENDVFIYNITKASWR